MNPALWISKTGLAAQDRQMSIISNNLANVNTIGFKRDRVSFEDLFYHIEKQPGALSDQQNTLPSGMQVGSGVRIAGTQKVFTPGSYQTTSQALDMAIVGNGFFQVTLPDGSAGYTRNGQFHLNTDGSLVTAAGQPVEPNIVVPADVTNLTVSEDGRVMVSVPGSVEPLELGQISLVSFVNPAGLQAKGGNIYLQTAASGDPVEGVAGEEGLGSVKQYTLETSNVTVVEELVNMISVQRAYEMNSKVISATDEMLQFANQTL
ncbi:flagellar basal-body rod protein FlgG [Parendozoicomonas haliclonae]|uniref:Flagellar basal-body rod protein FlgG n=1 Tax=Parendozoicomonas haliclonae TaxID=1960125 RepID=A0A1X7AGR9_9GAMM|nr:flagellar basal-body rod protein FlgG [Parendozoicomonas haliclonae]SMA39771.1 Flagellar basal-body rod protein FlgG [Parendozoicomonas haliclonae]